ncbi:MAG: putative HMP/thiamine import ATP-binding protein YkoD [Firmicutes bacterium ADurb.Bin373]|nr:ABC transporter ATP-binding protein [Bacillota bacterium]OQA10572.1 MAG: putative HMP/thiamine import ATP-binding protein YkoD [Firmicutes bacterium ADurb.Bin373]
MPLYKVENLTYCYPEAEKAALNHINLEIREGEFILVAGGSGSGKSSLARALAGLIPDFYGGRVGGKVYFQGQDIRTMDRGKLAREVGMVFQDPEKQIVQTYVEAEIAFGLENLGLDNEEMQRRVAEVVCFMNLEQIRGAFTANLSGGQKQKLALASVLAMQPRVLILDEPTSQLDPVSAEDILNLVKRLNEEMGFTVIMIEQRLERCYHLADRILLMEKGRITCDGSAREVARKTSREDSPFLPPVARFFAGIESPSLPLTVKEGRKLLRSCVNIERALAARPAAGKVGGSPTAPAARDSAVCLKNLWFTYPGGQEVLKDVSLDVREGEFAAVLGENGAGKSTMLRQLTGLLRPDRGTVQVLGKDVGRNGLKEIRRHTAYLSQNPNDYLFQDTVEEELLFTLKNFGLKDTSVVDEMLDRFRLARYRRTNPRDLSSGERQRVALASVLVMSPGLIILDEPTRGVDFRLKAELGRFLQQEAEKGRTVIVVTHDVEFAAEYAARIVMMSSGRVVSDGEKHEVLGKSVFYSPQLSKMCRGICDGVLTFSEARERIYPLVSSGAATGEVPGVMM